MMGSVFDHRMLGLAKRRNSGSSLLTGLAAFWKLDEASGTRNDSTLGAAHLSDNNTVTQAAGKIGNAAQFTAASSEFLSRASAASFGLDPGDSDWTFAAWVYLDVAGATQFVAGPCSGSNGWRLYTAGDRFVLDSLNASAQIAVVTNSLALSTATWYHIRAYHDATGNVLGLAVNNAAAQTAATSGANIAGGSGFWIGAQAGGPIPFDGRVDAAGFWNRLWTAAEITSHYNGGSGVEYPF